MHQIRQESDLAVQRQQAELRNQHTANIEGLRNEHRRMEAQRNKEIEKLRREQADLNQQLANATQKFQELKNRPGNTTLPVISDKGLLFFLIMKLKKLIVCIFTWHVNRGHPE